MADAIVERRTDDPELGPVIYERTSGSDLDFIKRQVKKNIQNPAAVAALGTAAAGALIQARFRGITTAGKVAGKLIGKTKFGKNAEAVLRKQLAAPARVDIRIPLGRGKSFVFKDALKHGVTALSAAATAAVNHLSMERPEPGLEPTKLPADPEKRRDEFFRETQVRFEEDRKREQRRGKR